MKEKIVNFIVYTILIFLFIFLLGGKNYFNKFINGERFSVESYNPDVSISNSVGRTYYQQMSQSTYSDYSQIIYDKLYENKENLKTGNYVIDFEYIFTDILNEKSLSDNQKYGTNYILTSFKYAIITFSLENPDVFYLDINKLIINIDSEDNFLSDDPKYHVYINCGDNNNYYIDGISSLSQVNEMEDEISKLTKNIIDQAKSLPDDYSKIKFIHDYLIDNIEYDETKSGENIHNIYGALVNKKCVCDGYSNSFQYFMNKLGIECVCIPGYTYPDTDNTYHQWNYVKLNNSWYALDATWDDSLGLSQPSDEQRYAYFLKGKSTIGLDHYTSWRAYQKNSDRSKDVILQEDGTFKINVDLSMPSSLEELSKQTKNKILNGDINIYLDFPVLNETDYSF